MNFLPLLFVFQRLFLLLKFKQFQLFSSNHFIFCKPESKMLNGTTFSKDNCERKIIFFSH